MITEIDDADLVVISDLHLGCPASTAAGRISKFLDHVEDLGASLCINGDGFDFFQVRGHKLVSDAATVLRRLRRLQANGTRVHLVLGNHDIYLEHLMEELPFTTVSPFLNLTSNGNRIRIEHGHLYDPFYAEHPDIYELVTRLGSRVLLGTVDTYAWWSAAHHALDRRRRRRAEVTGNPYAYHDAARQLLVRGFDAVVMGHTHRPELMTLPGGGTFANCGDWIRNSDFVRVTDGALTLDHWRA